MKTIDYSDVFGYGTVHAHTISVSIYGYSTDEITNPIFIMGSTGTYHFGINRVKFQMD